MYSSHFQSPIRPQPIWKCEFCLSYKSHGSHQLHAGAIHAGSSEVRIGGDTKFTHSTAIYGGESADDWQGFPRSRSTSRVGPGQGDLAQSVRFWRPPNSTRSYLTQPVRVLRPHEHGRRVYCSIVDHDPRRTLMNTYCLVITTVVQL